MSKDKRKYLITQVLLSEGGSDLSKAVRVASRALKQGFTYVQITDDKGRLVYFKAKNYQTEIDFSQNSSQTDDNK